MTIPRFRARRRAWLPGLALAATLVACRTTGSSAGWRAELERRLPVLGHRNFVVVADSAYPAQSSGAITTLWTGADHVAVVRAVLAAVDAAPHVAAQVYLDAELASVSEADAPGIGALRAELDRALAGRTILREPHIELIERLDSTAALFEVLVLKTTGALPYTSVFLELGCGYWSEEAEARLRESLAGR